MCYVSIVFDHNRKYQIIGVFDSYNVACHHASKKVADNKEKYSYYKVEEFKLNEVN